MKKKQSVIILHGWGLSGERFTKLKELLERAGYSVFSPDFPGFGKSLPPKTAFHLMEYADFLHDFIQQHHITRPILIGHSFGGRVSLKYQALYPNSIKAIIFTGTPGYTPVPRKKLILFITIAKIGKFFLSLWPLSFLQENIRKWYYYLVGAREFYRAEGVMRQVFKNIVQEDLASYITGVTVPCMLVWGENDQITPVWIAKRMNESIPGSKLVIIPDTDHGVSYKEPQLFLDTINGFLKTL